MSRQARRVASVLASLALLTGSCGIGADEEARTVDEVPFDLLGTTTSTTTTTIVQAPEEFVTFFLYWHTASDNRLIRFERELSEPPSIQDWLDGLVAGPGPEDLERVPDAQALIDATLEPRFDGGPDDDGVHRITISRPAEGVLAADQAAELVCTVLQFGFVERVAFQDPEGEAVEFSDLNAEAVENGATGEGFNNCEPQPVSEEQSPGDDGVVEEQESGATSTTTTTGG